MTSNVNRPAVPYSQKPLTRLRSSDSRTDTCRNGTTCTCGPRAHDDAGAILVLALIFLIVAGAIVGSLSTWVMNDLRNTSNFAIGAIPSIRGDERDGDRNSEHPLCAPVAVGIRSTDIECQSAVLLLGNQLPVVIHHGRRHHEYHHVRVVQLCVDSNERSDEGRHVVNLPELGVSSKLCTASFVTGGRVIQ